MRIFFLLLLAPLGAFAQSTPFYLADGLNDFSDQMIRGANPVYLTPVGTDSLIISTGADASEHASEYKRSPGKTFLRRTREWGTSLPNFVFLYGKTMVLVEEGGSYLLFLEDKDSADGMLGSDDKSSALPLKDSLRSIVTAINSWQRARNYRGEVLNENIPAIIKYRLNGKCYIQWRAFGYEALGGGNFGKGLYTYNKNDSYLLATGAGGSLRLAMGVAYEIDCN